MTYTFNPHRHVKIWLSKDRNTFLNLENRVRLVKMRDINPTDDIHFVYDSDLLSDAALADLRSFCTRYNIVPKDVRTDLFPNCLTVEEANLISIYNDEMSHLQQGGNVAVGSDILRWLKPVYELGTYTDFDVHVDTSKLSPTMIVSKPLLMSLGSTVLYGKAETVSINNDTISVVNCDDALHDIQKIQRIIHDNCSRQIYNNDGHLKRYMRVFQERLRSLFPALASVFLLQHPDTKALNELIFSSIGHTANEVRKNIISAHSTNALYARKYLSEAKEQEKYQSMHGFDFCTDASLIREAAEHMRKQLKPVIGWIGWLLYPKNTYKQLKALWLMQDDTALLEKWCSNSRAIALKNSVVYTSGPAALMIALYDRVVYDKDAINNEVVPFSFSNYGLDKAFISANSSPFHTSAKKVAAKMQEMEVGESNDLSWLQQGEDATVIREKKIREVQSQLPQDFHDMRKKIDAHIKKIQADLQGCLGFYRHRERYAKIGALQQILSFFDERQFNAEGFKAAVGHYRTRDVSASMGKSKTKQLIDELERFGQQAKHLMLTNVDGRVALPASEKPITSEDTGASVSALLLA